MPFNWHDFHRREMPRPAVIDPQRRLRLCWVVFLGLLGVVFGRAVQLEISYGEAFRAQALRPVRKETVAPGIRGRILARDGTVLACDRSIETLVVHYRFLEDPPEPGWLRKMVRSRLKRAERQQPDRVAAEETRFLAERRELAARLAKRSGLDLNEWNARARAVQARVQRIAESVRRRRIEATGDEEDVAIVEQTAYHILVEGVPQELAAEIERSPELFPGVKVVPQVRRIYPAGSMAAHILGNLGPVEQKTPLPEGETGVPAGVTGVEAQYEGVLRGRPGVAVELADHSGRRLASFHLRQPRAGQDLVLTLVPQLQRTAETLLDEALRRRALHSEKPEPAGGAIVVLDVQSGELLAAASSPRFDPAIFGPGGDREQLASLLADREGTHPFFDRAIKMALPPGSVFKTLTAAALLESAAIDPHEPFFCQGYLREPDRQRCAIYVHEGIGHGEATLTDALAQSCNVYFFHFVETWKGPDPLVDWARRFGFGSPSGVDLPGEAAGSLPTPETIARLEGHAWQTSDTQAVAIGQGSLTTTPLAIARMMAAVANGGRLVTPHVARELRPVASDENETVPNEPTSTTAEDEASLAPVDSLPTWSATPIAGLKESTLAAIRAGLEQAVTDPKGTAHAALSLESIPVAAKTGTATTGPGQADHAWLAGYVPADRPRLAFVVVLEHSGDAATAAGPVAKRLVLQMHACGLFSQ